MAILVFADKLRYLDANRAACQLLQRTQEEILGKHVGKFSQTDGARLARRVEEARGRAPVKESLTITLSDGRVRYVELVMRPNILPGRHVAFVHDVTERRQMQRELEHHNRLESIGKVAGGVAHDFNNMLRAILSYTDLQLQRVPEEGALRRYALGIQAAAERAAETTGQLLAFCRRQTMKFSELDINEIVEESANMVRRLIGEDIQLVLKLEPDLPGVMADAAQLNQVLVNLAVNARDAMPHGGRILFGASKRLAVPERARRAGDLEAGPQVSISVHDTGSGISAEVLPHIFDPFFTTKPQGIGTGLGLATVYGIVKQSKGQILVNSEPGRGTTFEIVLPAVSRAATEMIAVPAVRMGDAQEHQQNLD
jgi:two-component system cell cycle sensor histidine kinase/response regulator CckA